MKIYALLLMTSLCYASEKDDAVHDGKKSGVSINNVVTLNVNTQPIHHHKPGSKHPSVIEAHERLRRQQAEDDAVTCCCFFKIKKKI